MAIVNYSATANFGAKTALAIGSIREALAQLERVRDAASAAHSAANNWNAIEGGDFGIGAGAGQTFFDAINGLCIALNANQALAGYDQLDKGA